jgi:hypothetical protein
VSVPVDNIWIAKNTVQDILIKYVQLIKLECSVVGVANRVQA